MLTEKQWLIAVTLATAAVFLLGGSAAAANGAAGFEIIPTPDTQVGVFLRFDTDHTGQIELALSQACLGDGARGELSRLLLLNDGGPFTPYFKYGLGAVIDSGGAITPQALVGAGASYLAAGDRLLLTADLTAVYSPDAGFSTVIGLGVGLRFFD